MDGGARVMEGRDGRKGRGLRSGASIPSRGPAGAGSAVGRVEAVEVDMVSAAYLGRQGKRFGHVEAIELRWRKGTSSDSPTR